MQRLRIRVILLSLALIVVAVVPLVGFLHPSFFPAYYYPLMMGNQQLASGGPATIQVNTERSIYSCGDSVLISAQVYGLPSYFALTVQFQIFEPGGGLMVTGSSPAKSNGQATYQLILSHSCLTGVYDVFASIDYLGSTASADTGFTVEFS